MVFLAMVPHTTFLSVLRVGQTMKVQRVVAMKGCSSTGSRDLGGGGTSASSREEGGGGGSARSCDERGPLPQQFS